MVLFTLSGWVSLLQIQIKTCKINQILKCVIFVALLILFSPKTNRHLTPAEFLDFRFLGNIHFNNVALNIFVALLILFSPKTNRHLTPAEFLDFSFWAIYILTMYYWTFAKTAGNAVWILHILFQVKICLNREDMTEFWNWYEYFVSEKVTGPQWLHV